MINQLKLKNEFTSGKPFHHAVIDNFFDEETAISLSREFPDYNSDVWYVYDNPLENKKTCNVWNLFPRNLYSTFCYLNYSGNDADQFGFSRKPLSFGFRRRYI